MQIPVSPTEQQNLAQQIRLDYDSAIAEHQTRMHRWNLAYRKLMRIVEQTAPENRTKSNLEIPMMMWNLLEHIAAEHTAIFGAEAHIQADPTGDADAKTAALVGAGMHWLVYKSIGLKRKWGRFSFYRAFFGRAFAYRPYLKKTVPMMNPDGTMGEMTTYHAPDFQPIWPDDMITPAEEVNDHEDFSFLIHRRFLTLDELLEEEARGKMIGISANWERIRGASKVRFNRTTGGQDMRQSREQAEGADPSGINDRNGRVEVWYWNAKWRFPLPGPNGELIDVPVHDREGRDVEATPVVCAFIPEVSLLVSTESLIEMYPEMPRRRPYFSSAMNDSLGYWGPGYADLLFPLQVQATENHKIFTDSGKRNAIATVFMRPTSALSQDRSIELDPTKVYFTQSPADVQALRLGGDTSWCTENDQKLLAMAERLTGRSDLNSGRMIDRPNAPKTATQTMALLEAGNVRMAFNASNIGEDLSVLFGDYWRMWTYFGGERLIFRVTERDLPASMFRSLAGANEIEQAARNMSFDFRIEFAPSEFRRAALRQDSVMLLGLAMKNPVVMQSPRALWNLTRRVHELHGDRDFARLVPEPPELEAPKSPMEEWVRMQQGEEVLVNPLDQDEQHMQDHQRRILQEAQMPDPDFNVIQMARMHLEAHAKQLAMKRMMETAMGQVMEQTAAIEGGMGAPQPQQQPAASEMGGPAFA